jgi:hypothetical protein
MVRQVVGETKKRMTAKWAREIGQWGLVAVLISILLYFGDVSGLSRLPAINWPSILFVFLTTGGSILIHNLRWTSIVQAMVNPSADSKINFFRFFRWLLNSYALGTLIPSDISLAGVRTLYMNRTQILPFLPASFPSFGSLFRFDRFARFGPSLYPFCPESGKCDGGSLAPGAYPCSHLCLYF